MLMASYKCRLCGDQWIGRSGTLSVTTAEYEILFCFGEPVPLKFQASGIYKYIPHMCDDGSVGVSKFIGFKKDNSK